MNWLKNIFVFIKSPIGSFAIRMIIPLTEIGIEWTPTKTDDYYLAKIAFKMLKSQLLPKQLCGIQLTEAEQNSLIVAQDNVNRAYEIMIEYKKSKKKAK